MSDHLLSLDHIIETLLRPISIEKPCGDSLRYDPVYGEIKEARRTDDTRLSQGIWQTSHKKADWSTVESLCYAALTTRTKDLQLAGWLTESWVAQEGLKGLQRGLCLITDLSKSFWETMHPHPDQSGDVEHRLRILEWLDMALSEQLLSLHLTTQSTVSQGLTLADWMGAVRLDTILRRASDKEKTTNKATAEKQVTTTFFNQQLAQTNRDFLAEKASEADGCLYKLDLFIHLMDSLTYNQCSPFKVTQERLQDIKKIIHTVGDEKKNNADFEKEASKTILDAEQGGESKQPSDAFQALSAMSGSTTEQMRQDSYGQLADIAKTLEKIDPQSVVPIFLQQLLKWQGKTVIQFLQEYGRTPEELSLLVTLLGQSPAPISQQNTVGVSPPQTPPAPQQMPSAYPPSQPSSFQRVPPVNHLAPPPNLPRLRR